MNAGELRRALQGLNISQAQLAGLLNITPRTVTLWLSSGKAVPGPVEAYLRLMLATPMSARQIELQRLISRDGIYTIFYESGPPGNRTFGVGTLVLKDGRAYGGDIVGCKFEGTYVYDVTRGAVEVAVTITFPANVRAVFGTIRPEPWSIDVTATFDPRVDFGTTHLRTPSGETIDVQYRYVGQAPEPDEENSERKNYGDFLAQIKEKVEQRSGYPVAFLYGADSASLYKAESHLQNGCDLNAPCVRFGIVRGDTIGITYQDGFYEELPLPGGTYDVNRVADAIMSRPLSSATQTTLVR